MIDVQAVFPRVRRHESEPGIWTASGSAAVSYPVENHDRCFELEDQSFWYQHRNRAILAVMARFPPTGPLIDVGGGNGVVAAALEAAGQEVCLVNPALNGLRNARSRGVRNLVLGTLEASGAAARSVDAVGLFDVLEHIEDDAEFLLRLAALLKPGGRLFLTVPCGPWLWSTYDEQVGHHRRYSARSLDKTLQAAGFEIEFETHMFALLPAAVWLTRIALPALGGSRPDTSESKSRAHRGGTAIGHALLNGLLRIEVAWLEQRGKIPIGTTLLYCARRPRHR